MEDYPDPVVDIRSRPRREGYELKGDLPLTVHVNLSQVRRRYGDMEPENFDAAMRWCYYLAMEAKAMTTDEEYRKICRIVDSDPAVREADRRYREALSGNDERLKFALLQAWNAEMRYAGEMATAKVHAESDGMKKGLEEGIEEGIEEGVVQGRLETDRAMKADGMPVEAICRYTGLEEGHVAAL